LQVNKSLLKVHHDISAVQFKRPVVTIGIFDGVHTGHKLILERLKEIAARINGETVVITLWPHPRKVLHPGLQNLRLLSTLDEKQKLLAENGIDHLIIIPFTLPFSRLSSCEFIKQYLIDQIGISYFVVGYNHHFGRDREGDIEKIKQCAENFHFSLEKLDARMVNGQEVSSSLIREMIDAGNLREANLLLGYDFSLSGRVIGGNRLGRSIGFPTANIELSEEDKLIPPDGVYAVTVDISGSHYSGMLNIGYRPTVNKDKHKRSVEVHIFNFQNDLYNETITIAFRKKLRDEMRFEGTDQLRVQLEKDKRNALEVLNK
jgi:riboflavin kinase/FMN adenylyltransferase